MNEIRVKVVKYPDRKYLVMRYTDPMTGRQKSKSSQTVSKKEAERRAGIWEKELREGTYHDPSKTTWEAFRERYEAEVLTSLAAGTDEKVQGVFNLVERILNPKRLRDVTAERLSFFQAKLRSGGRSENTIASYLAHLKAALRWGARMGMIPKAPEIQRPHRAKSGSVMKGRPITREEFDRMLAKVESVVGSADTPSWTYYLEGLWLSGLRVTESLSLSWDIEASLEVDLSGNYPVIRIPAEMEKGHKDRVLPMSPEFAEFLMATPKNARTGYIFDLKTRNGGRVSRYTIGPIVAKIGEAAGVKVRTKTKAGKEVVKFASAHDLRRSFGERWAPRVMPQVLKELMRHETIETTLRFYVGRNAQTTASVLWEAHKRAAKSNTSGNSATSDNSEDRRNSVAGAGIEPARRFPSTGF